MRQVTMTPEQKRAAMRKKAALAAVGMVGNGVNSGAKAVGGGVVYGAKAVGGGAMAAAKGVGSLFSAGWGLIAGKEKQADAPAEEVELEDGDKSVQEIIDEMTVIMGKPPKKYQVLVTRLIKADIEKLTDLNEVTD